MTLNNFIQNRSKNIDTQKILGALCCSYLNVIHIALKDTKQYYPNFDQWFYNTVIPGLVNSNRQILIEVIEERLAGISIIKNSFEKKISTIKVTESFQGQKIVYNLFQRSFEALNTEKPFCTVSEEKLPLFQNIFNYYGFKLTSVHEGLYRKGKKEYFFNE